MEKKYAFSIIGILLAAFGLYVYTYPPVKAEMNSNYTSLSASRETEPSKLRMGLIEEMATNYRKTQLVSIENAPLSPVKEDSHSILFDLDTIKKFIDDIERGVKQVDPSVNHKLALRMYYAAYPAKEKWYERGYEALGKFTNREIPKLYERKHTIIMIPVIKTEKGIFADFNPFDKYTYNGFPKRTA